MGQAEARGRGGQHDEAEKAWVEERKSCLQKSCLDKILDAGEVCASWGTMCEGQDGHSVIGTA
jgi:hypothetical protein